MKRLLYLSLTVLLATATPAQAQRVPVTTTSDAARVQYVRGVHALAHADFAGAISHLDAAIAADPSFAMAHMHRASAASAGRAEHMRLAMAQSARISEGERQMIEAEVASQRGDADGQVALLTTVAERYPSDPLPMFIASFIEMGRGNEAAAVAAARRSLVADPTFAAAYNAIGYAEMAQRNTEAAEQAFREQIRLAPDEANPYDSYGEFLMLQGRLDEAEAQFEMALTKNPVFQVSRSNLVRIAVMRVSNSYERAQRAGDHAAITALHADGAVILPANRASVRGRQALAAHFAEHNAAPQDVTFETVEIVVSEAGDMAYEVGAVRSPDGGGKYLTVYRRTAAGWRIVADTWNDDAPAPRAATGSN